MAHDLRLVTVYTTNNLAEAQIVKGRLEAEGIPSIMKYESAGGIIGIMVNGLAQIEIQVPQSKEQKAIEILSRKESDYPTEPGP